MASTHHNIGLASLLPAQKKTAETRRRVPSSAQEALNEWHSRRLDLIIARLESSSSSRHQVVVALLDGIVVLLSSSSWCRLT